MYEKDPGQLSFEDFELPFKGKLFAENRWVKLSELIPWQEIEEEYSKKFSKSMGAKSKSARLGFGALIIKEKLGLTDQETVEQIRENPYLQFFVGFKEFRMSAPFDSSMMYTFVNALTEIIFVK